MPENMIATAIKPGSRMVEKLPLAEEDMAAVGRAAPLLMWGMM
jgi:hypothetical protein